MDAADKDRQIAMPALILWGARGQPPERTREFAEVWHKYAGQGHRYGRDAVRSLHSEEMPDHVYERFVEFFGRQRAYSIFLRYFLQLSN